jgi:hypothetical protein
MNIDKLHTLFVWCAWWAAWCGVDNNKATAGEKFAAKRGELYPASFLTSFHLKSSPCSIWLTDSKLARTWNACTISNGLHMNSKSTRKAGRDGSFILLLCFSLCLVATKLSYLSLERSSTLVALKKSAKYSRIVKSVSWFTTWHTRIYVQYQIHTVLDLEKTSGFKAYSHNRFKLVNIGPLTGEEVLLSRSSCL